ncbi:hypothetical protein D6T63_04220 [Arthrobacter cheniae]|uniref:Uncharacterized protein n=1 Tax=Arthrobacter cheniae TaxID=1258888 RepID=A0A3A5MDS3_9MICC|nr:hypothetical protein [Arthrobacter cheniae]RJT81960.1 hypothetical protein D6T63_04220 [Arthrobacter cheniae]
MSVSRTLPLTVRQLLKAADAHKVTIPVQIRKELDRRMGLINAAAELNFTGKSVPEAVNDSLEAGTDPFTDQGIQEAIVMEKLRQMSGTEALTEVARTRLYTVVADNLDEIVEAFKPVYDEAGQRLSAAHAVLIAGGMDDLDDERILKAGIEVARANTEAREALHTLQALDSAINMLLSIIGRLDGTPVGSTVRRLHTGDTPADDIRMLGKNLTHWAGVSAGHTVSLAGPTETNKRREHAYAMQEGIEAGQALQARRAVTAFHHGAQAAQLLK